MKIPTVSDLLKWVPYSIGVFVLIIVFSVGALAAPYIPTPFKATRHSMPVQEGVGGENQMAAEVAEEVEMEESKGIAAKISGAVKRAVSPVAPVLDTNSEVTESSKVESTHSVLQIENVKSVVEGNTAVVTWSTSIPAESRLIAGNGEGRVFESQMGLSTTHRIQVAGLEDSEEYDYKITATTEDKSQYDDHYGIIYAPKKYTATLGQKEGECQIIIVKDTAGKIASGKEVKLSPSTTFDSGRIIARGTKVLLTNSRGEIKYCEVADTFRITGEELSVTLSAK